MLRSLSGSRMDQNRIQHARSNGHAELASQCKRARVTTAHAQKLKAAGSAYRYFLLAYINLSSIRTLSIANQYNVMKCWR